MTKPNELRALLAKATATPWFAGRPVFDDQDEDFATVSIGPYSLDDRPNKPAHYEDTIAEVWHNPNLAESAADNAALIVAAVNALPHLLSTIERLQRALEPFSKAADRVDPYCPTADDTNRLGGMADIAAITFGDLRNARKAIEGGGE